MYESEYVSIIIPTYNRSQILKSTLPSYTCQKYVKEIIIVNDGGSDDTKEMLQSFNNPKIKYVEHKIKLGSPSARNTGIRCSTGKYILFGEDDVEFSPVYTEKLLDYIKTHNYYSIVSGKVIYLRDGESWTSGEERVIREIQPSIVLDPFSISFKQLGQFEKETFFLSALSLIKREVFGKLEFNLLYRGNAYREETDFYIVANKLGFRTAYVPTAIAYHLPRSKVQTGGQQSMSKVKYEYWVIRNHWLFLSRHFQYLRKVLQLKHSMTWYWCIFCLLRLATIARSKLKKVLK